MLLAGFCLCVAACSIGKRDFSPLGPVTTAELWVSASDGPKRIWKISGPEDLARIAAFVDSHRTDWGTPWYGIPVPSVKVRFFDGRQAKGNFGAGRNFFETQRQGAFFPKNASPSEIRDFYDFVNLERTVYGRVAFGERSTGAIRSGTFREIPGFHREAYCGADSDRDNHRDSRLGGPTPIGRARPGWQAPQASRLTLLDYPEIAPDNSGSRRVAI